jgi:thiamine biosynthesis lipoprotein
VYAVGARPDGKPWRVAVQNPFGAGSVAGVLELTDASAATSGTYERGAHIIDPRTGMPAASGLASVTVVCPNGAYADALSTGLFVLGRDGALDVWRAHGETLDFELVLIGEDGEITVTAGLDGVFAAEPDFADFTDVAAAK